MKQSIIIIMVMILAISSISIILSLVGNISDFQSNRLEKNLSLNQGILSISTNTNNLCIITSGNEEIFESSLDTMHRIEISNLNIDSSSFEVSCCTLQNECFRYVCEGNNCTEES